MRQLAVAVLAFVAFAGVPAAFAQEAGKPGGDDLCLSACDPGDDPQVPQAPLLDATVVWQSVPTTMYAGQTYTATVIMRNAGSEAWAAGGLHRLGSQGPQDNTRWGTGRVLLSAAAGAGQNASFTFSVVAPQTVGTHDFQWRMVKEGADWFGATTPNIVVTVKQPNQLPTVALVSPTNASSVAAPAIVTLLASAADVGGSVASVEFWANGVLLGSDNSSPFSLATTPLAAGTYQLQAVATDNEGAAVSSSPVTLNVNGPAGSQVSATRTYVYDAYERLCKTVNPESGATVVEYDAAGNVAWSAEGLNLPGGSCDRTLVSSTQKVSRTYDKLNRLLAVTTPGGTADLQQSYFEDGQVKSLTVLNPGKNKVTTSYTYNRRRLLTGESSANGSTLFGLAYGYDANGSLASLTYPDNHVVGFAPDPFGRATRVTGTGGVVYARDIHYSANGAISDFVYGNGIKHVREGNLRQLPSRSLDSYFNGATEVKVLDDLYAFDANGNVTDITDRAQNGLTTRGMAYDALDRLTAAVSPQQWGNAVYAYDALDNLRVADQGARQYRYNYDAANRLANIKSPAGATLITLAHDVRGNTVSKNSQAFVFDAVNRMNQVTGSQTYRYDGQGRRVQTTDADGKTTFWIYSQSGQVVYTSEARRSQNLAYIYLGNTQVATRAVAWGAGTATVRYQHTDSLGSIVAETDVNRGIVKRNSYTPYGEAFGSTLVDGTGYTGHVMDRATGLTYMQQRYYDPQISRFLSVDPIPPDGSGTQFDRYTYAANNPNRFTDPDGRQVWEAIRGFIAPTGEELVNRGVPGTLVSNSIGAFKQATNTAINIASMSRGAVGANIPIANNELEGAAATELAIGLSMAGLRPASGAKTVDVPQTPGLKLLGSQGGPGAGKRFAPWVKEAAEAQAGGFCVFCGVRTTREPGPFQRNTDHSIAKSKGGNNTLENAQNSCRRCNLQKGTKSTVEYLVKIGTISQ